MTSKILALILAATALPASAQFVGGPSNINSPASSSGGISNGSDFNGDDIVAKTISSTGTAPSLTATGGVFKGSVTVIFNGASVSGLFLDTLSAGQYPMLGWGIAGARKWYLYNDPSDDDLRLNTGGNATVWRVSSDAKLHVESGLSVGASYASTAPPTDGFISVGNVGIGTAAPGSKFHVQGGSVTVYDASHPQMILQGYNTKTGANSGSGELNIGNPTLNGLRLHSDANDASAYVESLYDNAGPTLGSIRFRTRVLGTPVEAMTITGSGNLGIGTASPAGKLDVVGDAQFGSGVGKSTFSTTGALTVGGPNSEQLTIQSPASQYPELVFKEGSTKRYRIYSEPSDLSLRVLNTALLDYPIQFRATGGTLLRTRTKAQLAVLDPEVAGEMFYCSDCSDPTSSKATVVIATGTNVGNFGTLPVGAFQ